MSMRVASLLLVILVVAACRSSGDGTKPAPTGTPVKATMPELYPDRGAVLEAIESFRIQDAEATLKNAPDTADVHYLRAKLAYAKQDGETAYQEAKKAVDASPGFAEYQYELGTIAPLPVKGLTIGVAAARFVEAGRALARATELRPDEPKYVYARAYFLSVAPPQDGGDPAAGRKLFDEILTKHADTAWAKRVEFDRAAESGDLAAAEAAAKGAGERDARIGAQLWLLAAGSRLVAGEVEKTRADLEAAAKLHPPAAGGFCDAGFALDGGGNAVMANSFWKRCLELDPAGPKSGEARTRVESIGAPVEVPTAKPR